MSRTARGASAALVACLALALSLLPGAAEAQPYPDGTFVANRGMVYRIAGGAPLYVTNWDAVGGSQPSTELSDAQFAALPAVPADQTYLYASGGGVFIVAGGAAIFLSDWAHVGGPQPGTVIDQWDIDNPDNPAAHLRRRPLNGTFLRTIAGRVYRVAGGATFPVRSWASFGGVQPSVLVDQYSIDRPDTAFSGLGATAVNGTQVVGVPSNAGWTITGGRKRRTPIDGSAVLLEDAAIAAVPDALEATSGGTVAPGLVGSVVLTGKGFGAGDRVTTDATGVSVLAAKVTDAQHIEVTLAVPAGTATGSRNLTVKAPDGAGATCTGCLTIAVPATTPDPTPLVPATPVPTARPVVPVVPRFLPSFVTARRHGRVRLLGVQGMDEVPRGAVIRLRCLRGCHGSASFPVRKRISAKHRLRIKRPPVITTKSIIEVSVSRPDHLGRYAQFKFTRVGALLIGHRFRSGCLAADRPRTVTKCGTR